MAKLKLKFPHNTRWRVGYLVHNSRHDRQMVILYNDKYDRTSTNYAKYLMEVKLGKFLDGNEVHVDHKNDDKTMDSLLNLQVLPARENIAKENRRRAR